MKHTSFTIQHYCSVIQHLLLGEKIGDVSDITNLIKYYGTDYAEKLYNRHNEVINNTIS